MELDPTRSGLQALMAEGLLLSGRMLKDHMLGAVLEGLDGAIETSKQGQQEASKEGKSPIASLGDPARKLGHKIGDARRAVYWPAPALA